MTNPDNIVRVRARNGGRASVYEANGWAQAYTSGILEGDGVTQNTSADMNVLVGGSATKPDVVLAENPAGYKIALDLVGKQAIALTAPASNSRISAIVAYTDDLSLATTEDTVTGSPASCGLIVVNGTAASTPVAPTDSQIRTAITSDGATGSQAAYCVIATVLVASGTTTITDSLITMSQAGITSDKMDSATSDVTVTFRAGGASAPIAGTGTAKLIKLSNGIGMLVYSGDTSYNDAGTGSRQMRASWSSSAFTSVIGGAVNSYYSGNGDAYQQYCEIGNGYAETYVYKSIANSQMRRIQFVIIGTL